MRARGSLSIVGVVAVVLACWLALGAGAAQAKPGQLDRSFGERGEVTLWVGEHRYGDATGELQVATAGGGTLVAALGKTVVKRTASGNPDRGFGRNGWLRVPLAPEVKFRPNGLAIDPEGRIVLAGTSWTENREHDSWVTVFRFLRDGATDPSFGSGGVVSTYFGLPISSDRPEIPLFSPPLQFTAPLVSAYGLVVDPKGRPVVTGAFVEEQIGCYPGMYYNHHRGFAARLQTDGTIDPSYGSGGVIKDIDAEAAQQPLADGKGRIVFSASNIDCLRGVGSNLGLRRLTANGRLDSGFGPDALSPAPFVETPETAIDRFGRILVAGNGYLEGETAQVRRLSPNGFLDRRYDGTGLPAESWVYALGVDRKGRALLAMATGADKSPEFSLLRRNREGGVDKSFGRGGSVRIPFSTIPSSPWKVLVDGRGRIVVGAITTWPDEGEGYGLTLVRFRGGRP